MIDWIAAPLPHHARVRLGSLSKKSGFSKKAVYDEISSIEQPRSSEAAISKEEIMHTREREKQTTTSRSFLGLGVVELFTALQFTRNEA